MSLGWAAGLGLGCCVLPPQQNSWAARELGDKGTLLLQEQRSPGDKKQVVSVVTSFQQAQLLPVSPLGPQLRTHSQGVTTGRGVPSRGGSTCTCCPKQEVSYPALVTRFCQSTGSDLLRPCTTRRRQSRRGHPFPWAQLWQHSAGTRCSARSWGAKPGDVGEKKAFTFLTQRSKINMGTFPRRRACYGVDVKLQRVTRMIFAETCHSGSVTSSESVPRLSVRAARSSLSQIGKVLHLFLTFYGQERSKQGKTAFSRWIIFFADISTTDITHLSLPKKPFMMFLPKNLSQL